MKDSELRELAQQIADAELVIHTSKSQKEIQKAQQQIIHLSSRINIFDFGILDDMVQEILKKKVELIKKI